MPRLQRLAAGHALHHGQRIGSLSLPIGRFGNAGAGPAAGPSLFNLSTGLSKSFAITEQLRLRAEGTFTNVLNHTNLGDPQMNISSASFGQISNTIGTDFGGARTWANLRPLVGVLTPDIHTGKSQGAAEWLPPYYMEPGELESDLRHSLEDSGPTARLGCNLTEGARSECLGEAAEGKVRMVQHELNASRRRSRLRRYVKRKNP